MYRRLPHNPNYYGLSDNIEETEKALNGAGGQKVAEHLSELVEETMKDLHDSGCIDVSETEDVVTPMNLGKLIVHCCHCVVATVLLPLCCCHCIVDTVLLTLLCDNL